MMMPEDFLVKLSSLGKKSDEICEKVLEAGGEIVLEKTKSNLASVIGSGTKYDSRSTGELERSLGLSSVRMDRSQEVTETAMQRSQTFWNTANTVSLLNLF